MLPRATGFLRSLERAPIDVEKEYVRRRLSGKTASSNASTPTWFSETVIGMRDGATREQRNALDTFLAACGRLAGGARRIHVQYDVPRGLLTAFPSQGRS